MCRIAGIIDSNKKPELLIEQVKKMCTSMAHGGPDGEGFFFQTEDHFCFGHRRLAIIDLSKNGAQPMHYLQNRFTISFNGEIYNYFVLKAELQALDYTFNSNSDTEVILAGFAHWGTAVFEKLNGMFAFALFDNELKTTYLVRDRAGIKPLYYSTKNQGLIFASEIKAFKGFGMSENANWKIFFLAFGHIPAPFSTLDQVFMLTKGHYLLWNHTMATADIVGYHLATYAAKITDRASAMEKVQEELNNAVERHLLSDAPIGLFLSGGIDSSILAILADKQLRADNQPLHTLSINFAEEGFSERIYQETILEKLTAVHSEFQLDQKTFDSHFTSAVEAIDQPTADGINSWFISYYAKAKGLKAVISGIGADELFGGYPSFSRMRVVNLLSKLPSLFFKTGLLFNSTLAKRSYYLSYKNNVGKYLFLRGLFAPQEIAKLLNVKIGIVNEILKSLPIPQMADSLSTQEHAGWLEYNLYMQNQLLKDTDSMSMQHGVEVRLPFLDNEFIQLLNQLPAILKYPKDKKKGFLIDSFISLLPEKIWNRPKMGFTFPLQHWLNENKHFNAGFSTCENKKARELIGDFKKGKLHWSKAMVIYQILVHD